ncbi:HAD family phosphatase [Streptomyces sp. SID9727]|uniref:HAD family hydrolase n=1 Tax=Streptomyces sp. SID9727 TaxID=2706114 RepID=UPI0013C821C8|nr:HAD family phosphatase [Streptomyces sp. SID9727]NEC68446.1 HAD family phosphatase [Streptomyces sp. SID9727]
MEAVLFDLDGVLIDTDAAVAALWRRAAESVGRDLSPEDMRTNVLGCSPERTIERVFGDCPEADRLRVLEEVRAGEPELGWEALPGGRNLVRALAAAGVPLALVTSASAARATAVTRGLGLTGHFAAMVTWEDAARGKPDPQPYMIAADRLGVPVGGCVVFEDSESGVQSAVAAGATCVAVSVRGYRSELSALGAAHVITSLDHVRPTSAGPHAELCLLADPHG